jgi:hypothetical protein
MSAMSAYRPEPGDLLARLACLQPARAQARPGTAG